MPLAGDFTGPEMVPPPGPFAAFDITQTTGLFCLQPNGSGAQLPCTKLSKV